MIMRHLLRFPTTLLALAALSYSVELHFPHSVEAQSKAGPQEQFGYPTYSPGGVDMRGVAIYRILSISPSPRMRAIQIELQNSTGGWYVGASEWFLWIGDYKFRRSNCSGGNWNSLKIVCFTLSTEGWGRLGQGDPLILSWGDEEEQRGRTLPFSKLDKRLLDKKPGRKIGK
jgi:hypothetical protein